MHGPAYAVPNELANYAETVAFDKVLYCTGNINHAFAGECLCNTLVKSTFRNIQKLLRQHPTTSDGNGLRSISNEAIVDDTDIQAHDVPELQPAWPCQTMNYLVIHRNADLAGVLAITQKGAFSAVMLDASAGEVIHLLRSDARLDESRDLIKHRDCKATGRPHGFEIAFALDNDHAQKRPLSRPFFKNPS